MQTFTGVLVSILPTVTYGKDNKKKGGFVIETEGKYPKKIAFTVFEAKLAEVSALSVGSQVEVSGVIESREWQGKWFTDAICQGVKPLAQSGGKREEPFQVKDSANNLPF